jgi:hypothetical protein
MAPGAVSTVVEEENSTTVEAQEARAVFTRGWGRGYPPPAFDWMLG